MRLFKSLRIRVYEDAVVLDELGWAAIASMSIFLGLLNLIFSWLAFIKICIPYPKKGD